MEIEKVRKKFDSILESFDTKDKKRLERAFKFADKAHENVKRKSGEPFIVHPLSVSISIWEKFNNLDLMVAALLHDTVEDNEKIKIESIYKKFGDEIGFLVDALNKRVKGFYKYKKTFEDRTERLLWAGMKDVRVLILKIADRSNNLETLNELKPNKQVRMAFETQAIFSPIKDILKLEEKSSLKDIKSNLKKFLKEKEIKKVSGFKEYLYNCAFENFNHKLYDLVYENSDKIIWEIKDIKFLEELIKNKEFDENVEIEEMRMLQGGDFSALFIFKQGVVVDNKKKFEASSFKN